MLTIRLRCASIRAISFLWSGRKPGVIDIEGTCPTSWPLRGRWPHFAIVQSRGAKTVSRRKVKDLEQGAIGHEPLAAQELIDGPQYPTVLQGVKNNMIKFDKCVLLTRVGNFYELYFEHAEEYAPLLGLKLSAKRTLVGPVPMAGFPFFQLERFLKILVEDLNKFVAISEEFPVPPSAGARSTGLLFDRRVARVVTPGTLIDEKFLNPLRNNFLLAIQLGRPSIEKNPPSDEVGLAWLDLSTGDFFTQATSRSLLPSVLLRIGAREILLPPDISDEFRREVELISGDAHELVTSFTPSTEFSSTTEWDSMLESPATPGAANLFTQGEKLACHAVLDYIRTRLQSRDCWLRYPQKRQATSALAIDRSSLRGLEILETSRDGFGKGSLFHAVRRTVTNSGARLLRDHLTFPSASLSEIESRLDLLTIFYSDEPLSEQVVAHLRRTYDVKRLVQKFALNKGNADDMLALAKAVDETAQISKLLDNVRARNDEIQGVAPINALLSRLSLSGPIELTRRITDAIDEEGLGQKHQLEDDEAVEVAIMVQDLMKDSAPDELLDMPREVQKRGKQRLKPVAEETDDVWIMRREASSALARLHENLDELKQEKDDLQNRLRDELSASSLTLRWTPGLGHICHIKSATAYDKEALDGKHARMVSSSKSTRSFYLSDWSRLGSRIDQARTSIRGEEQRLFNELRNQVIRNIVHLRRNATVMDELDVATAFALLAREQGWTRPVLNEGLSHKIIGGRHPTVEFGLEERGRSFVSNDLLLGEPERVWIVTGPNMAGKSTFLRQNALITILAQVGSYVPADYAEIGIVDQIFSRIGAADDLFRDRSTFMVEMLETAAILQHATTRSFVIVDEVGRGTTPEDGAAVAFATLHHLYHHNRCRTLFATHFHALHDLTADWQHVGRYCADLAEEQHGAFSFLHKLRPGINTQSHALKIARMAGLPETALAVAQRVLSDNWPQKKL